MGLRGFIGKIFSESDNDNKRNNKRNFEYLDDLIHDDSRVIKLDSDITLDDAESSNYANGIKLDRNYLIIEGNNHTIDAKNKASIFHVEGKQIQIFDINFVNANGIGALNNSCAYDDEKTGLTLTRCSFKNNNSPNSGAAIKNHSPLKLVDTDFINNRSSEKGGAIANFSNLFVLRGNFTDNSSNSIYNKGSLEISNAVFSNPNDEEIYSEGETKYIGCTFKGEFYQDDVGGFIDDSIVKNNFYYLEKLVLSSDEVKLDEDIILKFDESNDYNDGIKIYADGLVLDGCGHSIDANNVARIFNIAGKNIVFK